MDITYTKENSPSCEGLFKQVGHLLTIRTLCRPLAGAGSSRDPLIAVFVQTC